MKVTGYSDRWSAAPGETIRFYVHCDEPTFSTDLVRLIHGDENPKGPGFKEEVLQSDASGTHPGKRQAIHPGSCVVVDGAAGLFESDTLSLAAWVWPTAPSRGPSTLIAQGTPEAGNGFRLGLDENGTLELESGRPATRRCA